MTLEPTSAIFPVIAPIGTGTEEAKLYMACAFTKAKIAVGCFVGAVLVVTHRLRTALELECTSEASYGHAGIDTVNGDVGG